MMRSFLFLIITIVLMGCQNQLQVNEISSESRSGSSEAPLRNSILARTPTSGSNTIDDQITENPKLSQGLDLIQSIDLMGISLDVQQQPWDFSLYRNGKTDYGYAYAPTTFFDSATKKYYRYFCSSPGNNSDGVPTEIGWDYIRVVSSFDAVLWSAPKVVLYSKGTVQDLAACDPSIIKMKDYYYLFFSSWRTGLETFNAVARSKQPEGPFEVWRQQSSNSSIGYWGSLDDINPAKPIQSPINSDEIDQGYDTDVVRSNYGLGQPSVVVINQEFHMWYVDDSRYLPSCKNKLYAQKNPSACGTKVYYAITNDPVRWPRQPRTESDFLNTDPRKMAVEVISSNVASMDVKYDPALKKFYMFYGGGAKGGASILMQTSEDGIHWKNGLQIFGGSDCSSYGGKLGCPEYIGEVGALGDESGYLIQGAAILSMKVANDLDPSHNETNRCSVQTAPNCYGFWDLYDIGINLIKPEWNKTLSALQNKKSKWGDSLGQIRSLENLPPVGQVQFSNNTISGWAFDPDSVTVAKTIKIQIFDEVGFPTYTPVTELNTLSSFAFNWSIPMKYFDNQPHTLFVYALDSKGTKHLHLGTFTVKGSN